jgi:L-lysine cyclodeaminase
VKTLVIARSDVAKIVADVGRDALMDELIHGLTDALRAYDSRVTEVRKRDGFNYDRRRGGGTVRGAPQDLTGSLLEWMPVMELGGSATIKTVSYNPNNPRRYGIPTILATTSQYDVKNGHLVALSDGVFLTALRTGASSAIATRILARRTSSTVGMIGCGAQAVTQLHALSRVCQLERVLIHDVDPGAKDSFPKRVAFLGLDVRAKELRELEAESDILCTATSVGVGKGPVFDGRELKPWVHLNAVGSDVPGKTECPRDVVERALVCPDFRSQAMLEGECQQIPEDMIGPSLAQLVKAPETFEAYREKTTLFDSTGFALEDKVVLELFLAHAARLGLGTAIAIEAMPSDPLNPYSLSESEAQADGTTLNPRRNAG